MLDAAVELAGERGVDAVTHRAVAQRAELPLWTTTYFFDSITELTVEALQTYVSERVDELDALTARLSGDELPADLVAQVAHTLTAAPARQAMAEVEVYLAGGRHPELQAAVGDALRAYRNVAETVLAKVGVPHPAEAARAMHALTDGFMLHHLANPSADDEEALRQAMLALLVAYVIEATT